MIYRSTILVSLEARNAVPEYLYVFLRYFVIFVVESVFSNFVTIGIVFGSRAVLYMSLLFGGRLYRLFMRCSV